MEIPILKELWEIKDRMAAECNNDVHELNRRLKEKEKKRTNFRDRSKRKPDTDDE